MLRHVGVLLAIVIGTAASAEAAARAPVRAVVLRGHDGARVCLTGQRRARIAREGGIVLRLTTAAGARLEQIREGVGYLDLPATLDIDPTWPLAGGRLHLELGVCVEDDGECLPVEIDLSVAERAKLSADATCR